MVAGRARRGGTAIRSFPRLTLTSKHIRDLIAGISVATGEIRQSTQHFWATDCTLTVGDGSCDRRSTARAFHLPELNFVNCSNVHLQVHGTCITCWQAHTLEGLLPE
jgi:hypothetical protein